MGVRRERVILDLDSNLAEGLARDAVASRLLRGELDRLGTSSVKGGDGIDRTAASARKAGPEIDRFSGRLKVLRDVALILGPALAPIGAGMVPLVGALSMGLAATALAGGTAALALVGVGDALKTLTDYQLEPTAENLQAVRVQMEKLGPDGEHFVKFLKDAEPALRDLQMTARAGLLPGVEDGITSLLTDLPQIRDLVSQTARAMGELTGDAGADLAGPEWQAFWDYLQTDAAPTLEAMGRTIGNFAQGFSMLVVGLAPATRDFTTGLEGMSQSFANWSAGLENNEDFQSFLDYVRQSGPQVAAFVGELVGAVAALGQAMAPFGSVVLPALTQLLEVFAALAKTDVGGMFVAAAAGMAIYSRGAATAATATAALSKSISPWSLAAAAVAVSITDLAAANDDLVAATQRGQDALDTGNIEEMQAALEGLNATLDETKIAMYPEIKESFTDRVQQGIPVWGQWRDGLEQAGDLLNHFGGAEDDAKDKATELENAIEGGRRGFLGFTGAVDEAAAGLQQAEDAAADFQSAIAGLDAWLSKRGAIRNYREQVEALAEGLKDGFGRADREQIDATVESISALASQIKDPGVRADFLKNARASLMTLAENAGPKARAEIQKVIAKLDEFGLTKPKSPKLDVDTSGVRSAVSAAMSWLNGIPDEQVNINVTRRYKNALSSGAPDQNPGTMGELVSGGNGRTRAPRTSGRATAPTFGRGSTTDKAFAFGGARGGGVTQMYDGVLQLYNEAGTAAQGLKGLNRELRAAEKAVARETRKRDALQARRDAVSGAISGDLSNDLFAVSEASGDPWAAGSTPGGTMDPLAAAQARRDRAQRYIAAIRTLKGMGLDKGALSAIISEGLEAAEFMASQPQAYVSEFASTLAEANQFVAQASNMGANAIVSVAEMNAANAELREANKELKAITKAIKQADKNNQDGQKGKHDQVLTTVNRDARDGRRRADR